MQTIDGLEKLKNWEENTLITIRHFRLSQQVSWPIPARRPDHLAGCCFVICSLNPLAGSPKCQWNWLEVHWTWRTLGIISRGGLNVYLPMFNILWHPPHANFQILNPLIILLIWHRLPLSLYGRKKHRLMEVMKNMRLSDLPFFVKRRHLFSSPAWLIAMLILRMMHAKIHSN